MPNDARTNEGDDRSTESANDLPCAKRPYKTLALLELGDVRELTRGSATVGSDGGVGFRNARCLPPDARIATPHGTVTAKDVRVGDLVWTTNARGERLAAPVLFVRSVPAPQGHQMVRVELSDGRSLRASGLHPTSDGRTLDALRPGDLLDGATVVRVESVPYLEDRTYDLLPTGDTGTYWANGVSIGTTLTAADLLAHRSPAARDVEKRIDP
jgi:hypothetical protein